jgi:hypothetical protein
MKYKHKHAMELEIKKNGTNENIYFSQFCYVHFADSVTFARTAGLLLSVFKIQRGALLSKCIRNTHQA